MLCALCLGSCPPCYWVSLQSSRHCRTGTACFKIKLETQKAGLKIALAVCSSDPLHNHAHKMKPRCEDIGSCLFVDIWEIYKKSALHISPVPLIRFVCVYQFSWAPQLCSQETFETVFFFCCSFKFLWCFCLIIQCPFYSDMQDGRVREKNMRGCKSSCQWGRMENEAWSAAF